MGVRDRCKAAAFRTNERLRMLQEDTKSREKMRELEERELRYPSRTLESCRDVGASNWMTPAAARSRSAESHPASLTPSIGSLYQSPRVEPVASLCAGLANGLQFVQEFVAQEEKRLAAV